MPTEKLFFEWEILAEGNDSWNLMLEKNNFQEAYELSKRFRPEFADQIAAALAQQYFDMRKYKDAAKIYSEIKIPFERVALMFLEKIDEEIEAQYGFLGMWCLTARPLAKQDQESCRP